MFPKVIQWCLKMKRVRDQTYTKSHSSPQHPSLIRKLSDLFRLQHKGYINAALFQTTFLGNSHRLQRQLLFQEEGLLQQGRLLRGEEVQDHHLPVPPLHRHTSTKTLDSMFKTGPQGKHSLLNTSPLAATPDHRPLHQHSRVLEPHQDT